MLAIFVNLQEYLDMLEKGWCERLFWNQPMPLNKLEMR